MTKKTILLAAAAVALPLAAAPALAQNGPPLIPREKIFGNPTKTAGRLSPDGKWLSWIAPRDPRMRGSHISFRHPHAFELCQALIADGVIGDFRAPDVVRFGLTPLYLGYEDVWRAVERMQAILDSGRWRDPRFAVRGKVT